MIAEKQISKKEYQKLAEKIKTDFFRPINSFKTSLFLCGADISLKDKTRYKIATEFTDTWNSYWFDIVYPEDIFEELLYSSKSKDLLSLENLLAKSVDIILIVPESPGSFAELGAFANNLELRKKIVCLIDVKYKKNKSFINKGPIKLIKKTNKNGVLFIDTNDISKEIKKIISAIRKTKKDNYILNKEVSLLNMDTFLIPTIYLLEPVNDDDLINIVENTIDDKENAFVSTKTALTILTKYRFIENTVNGYILTDLGLEKFEKLRKIGSRIKIQDEIIEMDNLRLEILNFKLRNKKMKI